MPNLLARFIAFIKRLWLKLIGSGIEPLKPNPSPFLPPNLPKGHYPIIYARRTELDVELQVVEGEIPSGIYGNMYWTAPGGSVNSGGLPYPKEHQGQPNPEFGSPIMVSDGILFRLSFENGKAKLRNRLVMPPCLIADQATGLYGTAAQNPEFKTWGFKNLGMIRLSFHLGLRNLLNTALIPFQFEQDKYVRAAMAYDVGRHFEIDPESMRLMTPIGSNQEWKSAMPSFLKMAFPMVQSTAHPAFDPITKEFFTVNYVKSMDSILSNVHLFATLMNDAAQLEQHLENLAREWKDHLDKNKSIEAIETLLENPAETLGHESLAQVLGQDLEGLYHSSMPENEVFLLLWKGKQEPLKKWRVMVEGSDGQAKDIEIQQCMHQLQITRDYILLADSNFKTSLSIMVNNPFPHNPLIDEFLRAILAQPMLPYLQLYIIKRSDLDVNKDWVISKALPSPIPMESVHFSTNYENPNNEITLLMSVNSSACMAEWLRVYDKQISTGGNPVLESMLGMFAVGTVDLNKVGKYVISATSGEFVEHKCKELALEGNTDQPNHVGAHTWQLGLYTYRDIISPKQIVGEIKNFYTLSFGLDPRTLTSFIYNLYKDKPNQQVSAQKVKELSAILQTHALLNIETENMRVDDFYEFAQDVNPRAIQFVPKQNPSAGVDYQKDGYIICSMNVVSNPEQPFEKRLYKPQIWIFDANLLNNGPVCKLAHPDVTWGYGLHSAWFEKAIFSPNTGYNIDIEQDYNEVINQFWLPWQKHKLHTFFKTYVYPVWYAYKPK
jgi:carotenoid cleavage dioxygenase-like enzyme